MSRPRQYAQAAAAKRMTPDVLTDDDDSESRTCSDGCNGCDECTDYDALDSEGERQ